MLAEAVGPGDLVIGVEMQNHDARAGARRRRAAAGAATAFTTLFTVGAAATATRRRALPRVET